MKRTISTVLALVMVIGLFTSLNTVAFAASDYKYSVKYSKVTITKYMGTATAVTIPTKLGDYPVTALDDEAFENCQKIGLSVKMC